MSISPYVIVPVVIFVLLMVAMLGGRNLALSYVTQLYQAGKYDELVDFLDTFIAKALYPSYNRTYAKLNAYLAKGDSAKAGRAFDELLTMKTSPVQRKDLVVKAFEFYMNTGRHKDAKSLLAEIETLEDAALAKRCKITYDIIARKSHAYIQEMEAELEGTVSHARKLELSHMLAQQYRNKGDEKEAAKWQAAAEELLGMSL